MQIINIIESFRMRVINVAIAYFDLFLISAFLSILSCPNIDFKKSH